MRLTQQPFRMQRFPGSRGPDEVEALQTDVMRFMAILGFCLMVIFALVKSLPMTPADPRPKLSAPGPAVPDPGKKIKKPMQDGKAPSSSKQVNKKEAPRPVTPAKELKAQKKVNKAPAPEPVPSGEKGFILRFSSEQGLASLVSRGDVGFFAMVGNRAWGLQQAGDGIVFLPAEKPASFYEMAQETVPARYVQSFAQAVSAFGQGSVTYGVTLPLRTQKSIRKNMSGKAGGVLVIGSDGHVDYRLPGSKQKTGQRGRS